MSNGITFAQGITEMLPNFTQISGSVTATSQISGAIPVVNGGTGLTTIGLDQSLIGTSTGGFVGTDVGSKYIGYATALALTASGDQVITMSAAGNLGNYVIRRITWGMPLSSALATCIVVAVLRTASGGGGSAITGNLVVTGLSATNAYLDQTITLASTVITATQLYVQVTTAAATAPSSQIFIYGDSLGV